MLNCGSLLLDLFFFFFFDDACARVFLCTEVVKENSEALEFSGGVVDCFDDECTYTRQIESVNVDLNELFDFF